MHLPQMQNNNKTTSCTRQGQEGGIGHHTAATTYDVAPLRITKQSRQLPLKYHKGYYVLRKKEKGTPTVR